MKTLATASVAVAAVWGTLYIVPAPVPPKTAWYDQAIVYEIAVVFSLAAVVMLISRRMWTIRAIGLFFAATAIGVIGWNAVYVRHAGYTTRNNQIVPNVNPGIQEGLGDLWRALLMVGGPLLFIGLLVYLWGRFGPHSSDIIDDIRTPDYTGPERRSGFDRREGTRI